MDGLGETEMKKVFRRNLTVRLIMLFCLVILPINSLIVVITGILTKSYEEWIVDSYQNQIKMYVRNIDSEFAQLWNNVMNFLDTSNLLTLTNGGTDDSMVEVLRFKKQFKDVNMWGNIPGICCVWDKEKDIIHYFQEKKSYSMDEITQLEKIFRQREAKEGFGVDTELVLTRENGFIVKNYSFSFFSFGLMLDIKWILSGFYDNCGDINGEIYLADKNGALKALYSDEGYQAVILKQNLEEYEKDSGYVVLQEKISLNNLSMVQVIKRTELMKTLPGLVRILYILTAISFIALPVLCFFASRIVIKPLWKLCEAMGEVEKGSLKYHLPVNTSTIQMDYLYSRFNHMVDELDSLIVESYEKEIEKLQSDSINMRLQVNQHMLLNFLNTIYSMAQLENTQKISEFSLLLMKYFRYVLRQDRELVTVEEEMNFVQDYLQIQKIRFPESFVCVYSVAEEAKEIQIPQLLIENFVENSIKYGIVMGSEIEILINARILDGKLILSICDTGNGMKKEVVEKLQQGEIIEDRTGKHIGIWNCRRRLRNYYGDAYQLNITSQENGGTQIWMAIPMKPLNREEAAKKVRQMERQV